MKAKPKYWYFTTYHECPVCGRTSTYRERCYGKKPKWAYQRCEHWPAYDNCLEF